MQILCSLDVAYVNENHKKYNNSIKKDYYLLTEIYIYIKKNKSYFISASCQGNISH